MMLAEAALVAAWVASWVALPTYVLARLIERGPWWQERALPAIRAMRAAARGSRSNA